MTKTAFVPEEAVVADSPTLSSVSSLDDVLKVLAVGPAIAVPAVSSQVAEHGVGWATKTADTLLTMCVARGKKDVGRQAKILIWAGVLHHTLGDATPDESYEYAQKLLVGKDGHKVLMQLSAQGKQAVIDAIYDKEEARAERADLRKQINSTATMALIRVETELEFIERGVYGSDVAKVKKLIERLEASIRD